MKKTILFFVLFQMTIESLQLNSYKEYKACDECDYLKIINFYLINDSANIAGGPENIEIINLMFQKRLECKTFKKEGELLACIFFSHKNSIGSIDSLLIKKNLQKKGMGKCILNFVLLELKNKGIKYMQFPIFSQAARFYQKQGGITYKDNNLCFFSLNYGQI